MCRVLSIGFVAKGEQQDNSEGTVALPTRFRTVLYLDVFGWMQDPTAPDHQEVPAPDPMNVDDAPARDATDDPPPSTEAWPPVTAWIVVMRPSLIPHLSWTILANGAKPDNT